jgi:cyclohexyl-isocyanide hydratase
LISEHFYIEFFPKAFSKNGEPLPSDCGATLVPNYGFDNCPPIDILVVAGGGTTVEQMEDQTVINFLRRQGQGAKRVVGEVVSVELAKTLELLFEYRPEPPYATGSPKEAPEAIVAAVKSKVNTVAKELIDFVEKKHRG